MIALLESCYVGSAFEVVFSLAKFACAELIGLEHITLAVFVRLRLQVVLLSYLFGCLGDSV